VVKLTGKPAHPFLRRGIFFSHRDLNLVLDAYEQGKKFYLYTGIGPSSRTFHIGHLVPFMFTAYLQQAFGVPVVVQISDDEKFLKKDFSINEINEMSYENVRDVIACGFIPEKTFVFSNFKYMGYLYPTVCKVLKLVTNNQIKGAFGVAGSDNIGCTFFPAVQAAPSFPAAFIPQVLGPQFSDAFCLIPCGIDQDLYGRIARDVAARTEYRKPAILHIQFLPALQGTQKKASSSDPNSAIFISDSQKVIKDKIFRYAFSGGQKSLEEHRQLGADLDVDISYQYLRFFLPDDNKLQDIADSYKCGALLTSEIKNVLVQIVADLVEQHNANKEAISREMIELMTSVRRIDQ